MSTFSGFEDLASDFENDVATPKAQVTYKCSSCMGTGKYRGMRVHQERSDCFSCKGKGYFTTSPQQREKSKARYQQKKVDALAVKLQKTEAWTEANQELAKWLFDNKGWNSFAASLMENLISRGDLTERQTEAATRCMEKCLAKKAEKETEKEIANAKKATVDLSRVIELFDTAQASGIKKPKLRIGELVISIAPATGVNAGCLYVKDNGEYAGKVTAEKKYFGVRTARPEIEAELIALATNPMEAAKAYGQKTGNCSCCGRELTNAESIKLGIGPICASGWGF